jgi:hypothetical protein
MTVYFSHILNFNLIPDASAEQLWWRILITCLATFIVNLPFGYWRGGLKKLSFLWFLAIHAPVPFVILIRKFHKLELNWELAPFLVGSFFLGQFVGKRIYGWKPYRRTSKSSS